MQLSRREIGRRRTRPFYAFLGCFIVYFCAFMAYLNTYGSGEPIIEHMLKTFAACLAGYCVLFGLLAAISWAARRLGKNRARPTEDAEFPWKNFKDWLLGLAAGTGVAMAGFVMFSVWVWRKWWDVGLGPRYALTTATVLLAILGAVLILVILSVLSKHRKLELDVSENDSDPAE